MATCSTELIRSSELLYRYTSARACATASVCGEFVGVWRVGGEECGIEGKPKDEHEEEGEEVEEGGDKDTGREREAAGVVLFVEYSIRRPKTRGCKAEQELQQDVGEKLLHTNTCASIPQLTSWTPTFLLG